MFLAHEKNVKQICDFSKEDREELFSYINILYLCLEEDFKLGSYLFNKKWVRDLTFADLFKKVYINKY